MATHADRVGAAAVAVLADLGGRGLTHRAVDARAGLPQGTTSRYARTRGALLQLTADALFRADRATAASIFTVPGRPAPTPASVAETLAVTTEALLRAPQGYRARVELQLEAARQPALREQMSGSRSAFVEGLSAELARTGCPAPAVVDGILHREIVLQRPALPATELRRLFTAQLSRCAKP